MGLKKPSAGVSLPVLTNPAVADEIFYNKEAINQNGEVMTGTVINVNSSTGLGTASVSGSNLVLNSGTQENGLHINKGGNFGLITALSNLGNATAADVANGKTFTSSAGLKVAGTLTEKLAGWQFICTGTYSQNLSATVGGTTFSVNSFSFTGTTPVNNDIFIVRGKPIVGFVGNNSRTVYAFSATTVTTTTSDIFEFYHMQ